MQGRVGVMLRERSTADSCQNRITDWKGRHTKAVASSSGMGAAKARVITRKIKLTLDSFRIQKSGHTTGKDKSGEHFDLHNYVYDREDTRSCVKGWNG